MRSQTLRNKAQIHKISNLRNLRSSLKPRMSKTVILIEGLLSIVSKLTMENITLSRIKPKLWVKIY